MGAPRIDPGAIEGWMGLCVGYRATVHRGEKIRFSLIAFACLC